MSARIPDLNVLPLLPRDDEGPVFRAPWEAQAFGMAVALHEAGRFQWRELAERLAAQIGAARERGQNDDGAAYYHHWLAALEVLVADKRLVTPMSSLSARTSGTAPPARHHTGSPSTWSGEAMMHDDAIIVSV